MKTENNDNGKKKFSAVDVFLIVGALLLLLAVIGQDIAVYVINEKNRSDRFEVTFRIRSVNKTYAEQLVNARIASDELVVSENGRELGKVVGALTISEEESANLYSVSGTMTVRGTVKEGLYYPYGYGKALREGDRLYTVFEGSGGEFSGRGYTVEVTGFKLLQD